MMTYDEWSLLRGFRLLGIRLGGMVNFIKHYGCFWDCFGDWVDFGTPESEGLKVSRDTERTD